MSKPETTPSNVGDSTNLNRWGLPVGPDGNYTDTQWNVTIPCNGMIKCENRYSGYRVTAEERCKDIHRITVIHFSNPLDTPCVPKEQWSESILVDVDDIHTTMYQICSEYSTRRQ